MSRISWAAAVSNLYQSGVERAVLYPQTGPGVVWNGLVNVEEGSVGGERTAYYFDGIKYMDTVQLTNYQATISAFSVPPEFASAAGERSIVPGFILTRQPRTRFGLSYCTLIDGGPSYRLHLVYNAIASLSQRGYSSLNESGEAVPLSWRIDASPVDYVGYVPSAHYVLHSNEVDATVLSEIETILYGDTGIEPRLLTTSELEAIFGTPE